MEFYFYVSEFHEKYRNKFDILSFLLQKTIAKQCSVNFCLVHSRLTSFS